MARPQKNGLDYFALDVVMSDEVEVIEATYGLTGFAILIKLYQKIYSESYFLEWNEKQQILFSNRVSTDRNLVTSIVNDCIEWDIFDKGKYTKYNILTARRIQNHYFTSVYKRVNIEAIKEYLLIDVRDKNNLNIVSINNNNNEDVSVVTDDRNEDVSVVTDGESTQSKEDKSKKDKSKVNKSKVDDDEPLPNKYQDIINEWNQLGLSQIKSIKSTRLNLLRARVNEFSVDEIVQAIKLISTSSFLKGQNNRGWIITFDWFIKPNNFVKVLEGNYLDKGVNNGNTRTNDSKSTEDPWGIEKFITRG